MAEPAAKVVLLFAHPYPDRSRANRALLDAVRGLPGLDVRSLYDLYPDFAIDVEAEQAALAGATTIVWQHPFYWYSVPALLKLYFDKVLSLGWAYGEGGTALQGKTVQWVVTTGGDDHAYTPEGMHGHPFEAFVPPIEQTARFCGMRWCVPFVLQAAHRISDADLASRAAVWRAHVEALLRD